MNTISHSRRLRQSIEWAMPDLTAATTAIVLHAQFRALYPRFLVTVHQMVRATVPLMRTALARCRELAHADPVAAAMAPYFEQHIKEEMHHDEWLLEDLELLGMPHADVLRHMPSPAVASLIGAHYYWIHHHHPVAKLGQIAVMEGYPPSVEAIDLMVERTGFPRAAFRTLEKHCHLDTHHRDDFNAALDALPLTDEHHAILEVSALHTIHAAARCYGEVLEQAPATGASRSANGHGDRRMPLRRPQLTVRRAAEHGAYRIEDALGGSVYQIGEEEHFLLLQCDGRQSPDKACRAYGSRFGQLLTRAELDEFLKVARDEQLLVTEGT